MKIIYLLVLGIFILQSCGSVNLKQENAERAAQQLLASSPLNDTTFATNFSIAYSFVDQTGEHKAQLNTTIDLGKTRLPIELSFKFERKPDNHWVLRSVDKRDFVPDRIGAWILQNRNLNMEVQ